MDNKTEKSNFNQASWIALGSLSTFALSIISAAILSRYFDKQEYGTYRQIIYVYNVLLVVFSAGLPRVFSYYLPRYSLGQGKIIVNKINKILFFCGIIFSFVLFFSASFLSDVMNNPDLEKGLMWFSPVPLLLLPTLGIEGIFSTYKKTIYIAIYNTISKSLMLICIIAPVVFFEGTFITAIYGWLVASVINLIIAINFKRIPYKSISNEYSNLKTKNILKYSVPLGLASLSGMAIYAADQFYISRNFGAEVFAEFTNGYMELPFVNMITFSIAAVLMPVLSKMNHNEADSINIIRLWKSSLLKSSMLIYPLVLFFIFYASDVMTILFSSKYTQSSIFFKISLIRNFFNVIMFAPLLLSMGKNKFYLNIHLSFALIAWIGGYVFSLLGLAVIDFAIFATIRSVLMTLISFYYVSIIMKVNFLELFPVKRLVIIFSHSLATTLIIYMCTQYLFTRHLNLFELGFVFLCYSLILLVTSKLFNLSHLVVLKPIVQKVISKINL